jgi:7-cyano-7-deazaguanine synthase
VTRDTSVKRAVVLLSGGLDSATTLAIARAEGCDCHCLTVDYGQRHRVEIAAAARVARALGAAEHRVIALDLAQFGGSALTDPRIAVPQAPTEGIPVTYVPARNTIFLSLALAWAEVVPAQAIYFGANAVDYSGYPDCRPEYMRAFEGLANLATRAAVEGARLTLHTPIIDSSKAEIIKRGTALGVDYGLTVSCYQPTGDATACGRCDACRLRRAGFEACGIPDPACYVNDVNGQD